MGRISDSYANQLLDLAFSKATNNFPATLYVALSTTTPTNTGHVIVAINVAMFQPVAEFKQSVDAFVRDIRNSQRLPGVDAIRLPGEGSHARLQESLKLGAPLSAPLLKSLNDLAAELKIPALR